MYKNKAFCLIKKVVRTNVVSSFKNIKYLLHSMLKNLSLIIVTFFLLKIVR